jgi:hypothetical protein
VYFDLVLKAAEDYGNEDYASSIANGVKARSICADDWQVAYNLARAYHQAEECGMALFLYDELLERELDRKTKKKIQGYQSELRKACGESTAIVRISCEDDGVSLQLGEVRGVGCPFAGRLELGEYSLKAERSGYFSYESSFFLNPEEQVSLTVPFLRSLDSVGTLSVLCEEGVSAFELSGATGTTPLNCPWQGELDVGEYSIVYEGLDEPIVLQVRGQQLTETTLLDVGFTGPASVTKDSGFVVGLAISSGFGYASGELEEAGEHTGEDTAGPTYGSFAGLLTLGYAIDPSMAILARLRVDRGLGVLGYALFRYTMWLSDSLGLQFSGGAGGGEIVHPVFLDVGGTGVFRSSPVFVVAGIKLAVPIADIMALSVGLDNYLGVYSEFSVLADFSVALEFKF